MSYTFNWSLRDDLHIFKGAAFSVLTAILLHADAQGRAWPSNKILEQKTGYGGTTVSGALKHLVKIKAIVKIPHEDRKDKEQHLYQSKSVYQITGHYLKDKTLLPYIYATPETLHQLAIAGGLTVNSSESKDLISGPKDNTVVKDSTEKKKNKDSQQAGSQEETDPLPEPVPEPIPVLEEPVIAAPEPPPPPIDCENHQHLVSCVAWAWHNGSWGYMTKRMKFLRGETPKSTNPKDPGEMWRWRLSWDNDENPAKPMDDAEIIGFGAWLRRRNPGQDFIAYLPTAAETIHNKIEEFRGVEDYPELIAAARKGLDAILASGVIGKPRDLAIKRLGNALCKPPPSREAVPLDPRPIIHRDDSYTVPIIEPKETPMAPTQEEQQREVAENLAALSKSKSARRVAEEQQTPQNETGS